MERRGKCFCRVYLTRIYVFVVCIVNMMEHKKTASLLFCTFITIYSLSAADKRGNASAAARRLSPVPLKLHGSWLECAMLKKREKNNKN